MRSPPAHNMGCLPAGHTPVPHMRSAASLPSSLPAHLHSHGVDRFPVEAAHVFGDVGDHRSCATKRLRGSDSRGWVDRWSGEQPLSRCLHDTLACCAASLASHTTQASIKAQQQRAPHSCSCVPATAETAAAVPHPEQLLISRQLPLDFRAHCPHRPGGQGMVRVPCDSMRSRGWQQGSCDKTRWVGFSTCATAQARVLGVCSLPSHLHAPPTGVVGACIRLHAHCGRVECRHHER